MSAVIGEVEIAEVVGWQNRRVGTGGNLQDWCDARSIDLEAMAGYGDSAMRNCLAAIANHELSPPEAFSALAISGFQVGAEVERRRRDRVELGA